MSLKDQIEVDILGFFKDLDILGSNDRKETLRTLLSKYAQLSSSDFKMDDRTLAEIIDQAKTLMSTKTMPMFMGVNKKRIPEGEQATVCLIESTISQLNKNDCLKRLPKFEYKDNKF